MQTSRITISSFLVAAMSVYACLLLSEAQAHSHPIAAVNNSQSAGHTQEEQQTSRLDAQRKPNVTINRRPLTDLLRRVFSLQQRGEIDLGSTFEILIEGDRASDNFLHNVEITQKSGDASIRQIAEEFVAALNNSGILVLFNNAKRLRLAISSGQADIAVSTSYEADSVARARNTAQSYKTLFFMGAQIKKGRDEELLYKNLSISSEDREVIVNFSMPRETFCALLSKYLSSN